MRGRDQRGWVGKAFASLVVVALVVGGFGAWRLDLVVPWYDHFFATPEPAAPAGPAEVAPPPGLRLRQLSPAPVVDAALTPRGRIDLATVQAALAPYLSDPELGGHVVAAVASLTNPKQQIEIGEGAATPASTTKLLTTSAALAALGPEATFTTKVVSAGRGRVVLVGGGDPLLASKPAPTAYPPRADVQTLAAATAARLLKQGRTHVQVGYDDSLFTGPFFNPAWPAHYAPDNVVSPITALWVDEARPSTGYGLVADPSAYAAQLFTADLAADGITIDGVPEHGVAKGGATIAQVHSAPLREIVEHTLLVSDNEAAEVLSHQVGLKVMGVGDFEHGVAGVLQTLQGLGVATDGIAIHDGSGLSRENRIPPAALVAVLRADLDPAHPDQQGVINGLPVAGFTGSLTNRFDQAFPEARGLVRAKTGTLSNVSALAGIAVDQDGDEMLFALMADDISKLHALHAQQTLDKAAGALGACHCTAG